MSEIIVHHDKNEMLQLGLLHEAVEEALRRQSNVIVDTNIPDEIHGSNIFMGIGLMTTSENITQGLGIGALPIMCTARVLQQEFENQGRQSAIHVLVADAHALAQVDDEQTEQGIKRATNVVRHATKSVFNFIKAHNVHIHCATDPDWNQLFNSWDYTDMETVDILHAHTHLGCGLKIGWKSKRKPMNGEVIRDEAWFDWHAKTRGDVSTMGFVYTPEGISKQTRHNIHVEKGPKKIVVREKVTLPYGETIFRTRKKTNNTSAQNQPIPPYFGEHGLSLGQPIDLLHEAKQLTKRHKGFLSQTEGMLKNTIGIKERTDKWELLQALAGHCT